MSLWLRACRAGFTVFERCWQAQLTLYTSRVRFQTPLYKALGIRGILPPCPLQLSGFNRVALCAGWARSGQAGENDTPMYGMQDLPPPCCAAYVGLPVKGREHQRCVLLFTSFIFLTFSSSSSSDTGMKRPFSPSSLPKGNLDKRCNGAGLGVQMDSEPCLDTQEEGAVSDKQSPGGILISALYRPKRERKQRSYTLCEVCNIQLNSAAQAQIHYNGKSHQKRLKQISNGKMPNSTGKPEVAFYWPCVCL